jgi:hypothetical protein
MSRSISNLRHTSATPSTGAGWIQFAAIIPCPRTVSRGWSRGREPNRFWSRGTSVRVPSNIERSGGCFGPACALSIYPGSVQVPGKEIGLDSPSVKLPTNKELRLLAKKARVTSGEPSRIMRWTVMRPLNTIVHVESRSRYCSARMTSPTPASPECVATRMCSMYLVFGGAFCSRLARGLASDDKPCVMGGSSECPSYLDLGSPLDGLLEGARHDARPNRTMMQGESRCLALQATGRHGQESASSSQEQRRKTRAAVSVNAVDWDKPSLDRLPQRGYTTFFIRDAKLGD